MKNNIKYGAVIVTVLSMLAFGSCSSKISGNENGSTMSELVHTYDEKSANATISLTNEKVDLFGSGVAYKDGVVTISVAGTYVIRGEKDDLQVVVDAKDQDVVLVLDGVTITNSEDAPIFIDNANDVTLLLSDGTINTLSDVESTSELTEETERELNGVIYSKEDLTIEGNGSLIVNGNYKNGISARDNLVINSGNFEVYASNNGIIGKDSLTVLGGTFNIEAGNDAFQSDNEDLDKGYIIIKDGDFTINSLNDGIQAENLLQIDGGNFNVTTNGGSSDVVYRSPKGSGDEFFRGIPPEGMPEGMEIPNFEAGEMPEGMEPPNFEMGEMPEGMERPNFEAGEIQEDTDNVDFNDNSTESYKGLKSTEIIINGGTFVFDTYEDSIHSNDTLTINGGDFTILSGDDAIHADNKLTINDGIIVAEKTYEGIESSVVIINGGNINLVAYDDAINASGSTTAYIEINGGSVVLNSEADGLDSNVNLFINGGDIYINGPYNQVEHAVDFDNNIANINGGNLIALDNSVIAFSDTSEQLSFTYAFDEVQSIDGMVVVTNSAGEEIMSIQPVRDYTAVMVSSDKLVEGETYTITTGSEVGEITLTGIATANKSVQTMVPMGKGGNGQRGGGR